MRHYQFNVTTATNSLMILQTNAKQKIRHVDTVVKQDMRKAIAQVGRQGVLIVEKNTNQNLEAVVSIGS